GPGIREDAVRVPARDLGRPVARAAVDDHELLAPGDALEAAREVPLLVLTDDEAREPRRRSRRRRADAPRVLARGRRPDALRPRAARRAVGARVGREEAQPIRRRRGPPERPRELYEILHAAPA